MRPFEISRYMKKYTLPIVVFSFAAGTILYLLVTFIFQSFIANTVIRYPEGTKADTSEIYASNIVSAAMDDLGIDKNQVDTDYIRNNIKVTPIVSEDETMLKEAVLNNGEAYTNEPSAYLVTYTSDVTEGKEFARTMLNEILDTYLVWYGENYANTTGGANSISDIYDKDYDYIEMMELIDSFLDGSMNAISSKIAIDDSFRSYASGYSFSDLYNEFAYIKNNEASGISADILNNRITKNRDVLLSKYNKRNSDMATANAANQEEIDKIKGIIDSYVSMMSESGNTNITSEYILKDVYDSYYTDDKGNVQSGDITVQYDRLLDGYVADREDYEFNLLDTAYNQYVIDTFTGAEQVSSETLQNDVMERISALVTKLNNLYDIYDTTNDEFNEYLGASQVTMLSSIGVKERIPIVLLTAGTILLFGVIGCGGAIVFGRIGDVMEYYAFTDKVDGMPNRTRCDNFLAEREDKLLFGDYSAVVLKIKNLREVNTAYGRDSGNAMIKSFVELIKDIFVPTEDVFVGNNGSGQYLVFAKGWSRNKTADALSQLASAIELTNKGTDYSMECEAGMAEAASDKCYNIRKLLSLAMRNMSDMRSYEGSSHYANAAGVNTANINTDKAADDIYAGSAASEPEAKVVNLDDSSQIFQLGSDYFSKFRNSRSTRKH